MLFLYSFNTGSVWSVVDNTSKKISIPNVCNLALASSIYMNCSSTLSSVHLHQVLERESLLSKGNIIRVCLGILAIVIEKNCWIIIHNNTLRCLLVLFLVCSWYFWPFQPDSSEFDNGLSFGLKSIKIRWSPSVYYSLDISGKLFKWSDIETSFEGICDKSPRLLFVLRSKVHFCLYWRPFN